MVYSGPVPTAQASFIIGTGVPSQHNGITYPNPPPSIGVDYRVFVRVYSGVDVSQSVMGYIEERRVCRV